MSYFDQVENPNVFASYAVPITPMVSDILAMQSYYGSGSSVRTSNTNYGYNSNAGGIWDDFVNATESIALTIWDDGGIDTLDFSGTSLSQQINLIEESFSDILGLTGNLTIMRGTEIENAKGGGGADTLIGNALDNGLEGGGGNDALLDTLGDDTLMGGDGQDRLVSLAGTNTLSGEDGSDYLTGGAFNDTLNGNSGNDVLRGDPSFDGLGGSDVLTGGTGNDVLMGGRSADTFVFAPNEGADRIGHFDDSAVIYSAANGYQVTSLTQDFETGLDVIELQSFAGINASNVFDFISDVSGNAVFSAQGTSITLVGVTEADLGADNFIFV
ncbi:MAG: M10 family metallopeptidase C-terminal domain-containing protein [Pseudomonadota bacterium]